MTTSAVCRRCDSVFEAGDIRCAVCGHTAPEVARRDAPDATVEVLRCSGCGAAVTYSVAARAPRCAFCGSTLEVESPTDPLEEAELVLPFTFGRGRAEEEFRAWLSGLGWFRPGDLRSASRLESLTPIWWVGWAVDARVRVSWTADSDVGGGRADWAPHAGQTELELDGLVVPASRGLSTGETSRLLASYDLATARSEVPDTPEGAVIERFDMRRTTARTTVRSQLRRLAEATLKGGVVPGRRFRNLHTALLVRGLVTRRLGFPAWVAAYRYRGVVHRFVLSGQDPGCRMGEAPISVPRVVAALAAAALGIAALLAALVLLAS